MSPPGQPWYREPWPWILISGPAAVLIAGAATMWVAFASADGLVADDYYKQGLAINRRLAKEDEARRRGIAAEVRLERERLRVELKGEAPATLFVQLAHATRAGFDQRLRLTPAAPGVYEAELAELPPGHWHVIIEDPRGAWRIAKEAS
jgi:uncharacterized protein